MPGLTALGFGGIFTTLTFLSPLLQSMSGFTAFQVNVLLLLFGLAGPWATSLADGLPAAGQYARCA